MRRAPPVTSADFGTGGIGKPPCNSAGARLSGAGPVLGAHQLARRHAGSPQGRAAAYAAGRGGLCQAELGLFEPTDFVAQPRRFLEFEVGRGRPHALLEIGNDSLQVLALVMRRVALAQADRDVIALI